MRRKRVLRRRWVRRVRNTIAATAGVAARRTERRVAVSLRMMPVISKGRLRMLRAALCATERPVKLKIQWESNGLVPLQSSRTPASPGFAFLTDG